jgi:hypothetical protein
VSRRWLLLGVALFYVFSIPWYRSPDSPVSIWLGLPDWVAVALGCYLGAAILNALAWMRTEIPEGEADPPSADSGEGTR